MREYDLTELAATDDESADIGPDLAWWCSRRDDLECVRGLLLAADRNALDEGALDAHARPFVDLLSVDRPATIGCARSRLTIRTPGGPTSPNRTFSCAPHLRSASGATHG